MNAVLRLSIVCATFLTFNLLAGPSLEMPHEWLAPLEQESAIVLVQKHTGQAQIVNFDGSFNPTLNQIIETKIPNVTGLSTGFMDKDQEYAFISSAETNLGRLLNTSDHHLKTFQPEIPGPITAVPLRSNLKDSSSLLSLSQYGRPYEALQRYENDFDSPPTPLGRALSFLPVNDLQPSNILASPGVQGAIASFRSPTANNLFSINANATDFDLSFLGSTPAPLDQRKEKLASNCRGSDGRTCIIRYYPGDRNAIIVTRPENGFVNQSIPSNDLPFPIGRMLAIPPNVPGAPDGVLITSADGSSAVYAQIELGRNWIIRESFDPAADKLINGVIPVVGRGFVLVEGSSETRNSISWIALSENADSWLEITSGVFSPWLPIQQKYANMFWFQGTPLVDPTAEIIKMETVGDWVQKSSSDAIPAQIQASELMAPHAGLIPTNLISPSKPSGATFLLTSQYEDKVSITALDDDIAIQSPSLALSPNSGDYQDSITINALYDSSSYQLFYKEDLPEGSWRAFTSLTIGYPSDWLFYLKNQHTGISGPIIKRSFTFSGTDLNQLDTDHDGVPDYVEQSYGLDPAGGADSDGDFQSDLEEILAGTDPKDANSYVENESRNPPFLGEGFELIVQAFDGSNQEASPANTHSLETSEDDFSGELIRAHDMYGNLLAESSVRVLSVPDSLAGTAGAYITVGTPIPEESWLTLSSPLYFGVGNTPNPSRTGREILKIINRPINPLPEVIYTASGSNRIGDTNGWKTAAQNGYLSHETVDSMTELHPIDNAQSALTEQLVFDALRTLTQSQQSELGVPLSIEDFTLFPQRNLESSRTSLSQEMIDLLKENGYDFRALISLVESSSSNPNIELLANLITIAHASNSDNKPLMALPLDVFRSIIRSGTITDPAPGSPERDNPYSAVPPALIASVRGTFDEIRTQLEDTKRTRETWSIVIAQSTTPLHEYDYLHQENGSKVYLRDRFGERIVLEQGLGLPINAVFEITGFTDVSAPDGFIGLEFIQLENVVTPLASDADLNGNLLDDSWENLFFGDLGINGPFDSHPETGHSYLQYQLTGADPRSGSLSTETDPVVSLMPTNIHLEWIPEASAYDLRFNFPDDFYHYFNFVLESSPNLSSFDWLANQGALSRISENTYQWRLQESESNLEANFFRIGVSLSPN